MHISLSNIYHHFGNKEGLLVAILEHASKRLVEELRAVSEMDLQPVEKLRRLVETHIRLAGSYTDETKIFFLDEEHLSDEGEEINRQIQRRIYGFYMNVLKEIQEEGRIQSRHQGPGIQYFRVINWQLRWFRADGPLFLDEVKDEMIAFIMNGVLGGTWPQDNGEDVS